MLNILISLVYLFLYLPIVILIIFSFNSSASQFGWEYFSLKWYEMLFGDEQIWQAFTNSITVSVASTLLSILMGIGLVYYFFINGFSKKTIYFFYSNSLLPEVVLAVGLLGLFAFFSIPLSLFSLVIAHTVLALGYIIPLMYTKFLTLDVKIIEASYDLGATSSQTFFKVVLPLLLPSIISAGLLVFIISFDDFLLSFFCSGTDSQTLSLYIYNAIKTGVTPIMNALSAILLTISSILVFIFCSLNVRSKLL